MKRILLILILILVSISSSFAQQFEARQLYRAEELVNLYCQRLESFSKGLTKERFGIEDLFGNTSNPVYNDLEEGNNVISLTTYLNQITSKKPVIRYGLLPPRDQWEYINDVGQSRQLLVIEMLKDIDSRRVSNVFYVSIKEHPETREKIVTIANIYKERSSQFTHRKLGFPRETTTNNNESTNSTIQDLIAKATQGDADAQFRLGDKYYYGREVTQDYYQAVKWFRKAAEQGYAPGQGYLGYMYNNGYGVSRDYAEAVKWFRRAAEQGNSINQYNLGVMYRDGNGVSQDYVEAVKWFRKSAEQGYFNGLYNLGIMYRDGNGVSLDKVEAVKWFRKAAEQGYDLGQYSLGVMYYNGDGVPRDYDQAFYWYSKAAEQENYYGQYMLGVMYQNGYGVTKDLDQAAKWYKKACDNGYDSACEKLKDINKAKQAKPIIY